MSEKEIVLLVGANAEPNTCGSCKFFSRRVDGGEWYSSNGWCKIVLPKKIVEQWEFRSVDPKTKDQEFTGNEDIIKDTDRCDFYQSDGKKYIVQRRVGPK